MSELVSIIMPSFNTGQFIKDSIESVLNQTYSNWELIIVDDGSIDNTEEIVSKFDDERIIFIKNDINYGAAFCRNTALKLARGKWIAFLDSDDLWDSSKLDLQIAFMKENNYCFSYTEYSLIDEKSQPCDKFFSGPNKITKTGMYNYCWPGCLTVMYNAEEVGLIQIENIRKHNDYAIWLKICKKHNCYLFKQCLAKYRKRTGSISSNSYLTLIKWHYKLFREAEGFGVCYSIVNTIRNIIFGLYKKVKYVKKKK